jgi:hypothetical protein
MKHLVHVLRGGVIDADPVITGVLIGAVALMAIAFVVLRLRLKRNGG